MSNSTNDWRENFEAGRRDGEFGLTAETREQEWNQDYQLGRAEAEAQKKRNEKKST